MENGQGDGRLGSEARASGVSASVAPVLSQRVFIYSVGLQRNCRCYISRAKPLWSLQPRVHSLLEELKSRGQARRDQPAVSHVSWPVQTFMVSLSSGKPSQIDFESDPDLITEFRMLLSLRLSPMMMMMMIMLLLHRPIPRSDTEGRF